ncbi:MAG: N-methyl-L-tryptophan oxidase [Pseudomonadota bacterium]
MTQAAREGDPPFGDLPSTADVVVIGMGVIGAFVACALARRGVRTLAIDAHAPPHAHGSSHGETRMFRLAYAEGAVYAPLLARAHAAWTTLQREGGEPIFEACGIAYVGRPDGALISQTRASARDNGLSVEDVGAADAAARFPHLRVDDGRVLLFEPTGGFIHVDAAVRAALSDAATHGATLCAGPRVVGVEPAVGARVAGVTVRTDRGSVAAGAVVIAAGARTAALAPSIASALTVERRTLHWFEAAEPSTASAGFTPFCFDLEDEGWFYGFPPVDGATVKVANHHLGSPVASMDAVQDAAPETDAPAFERWVRRLTPGLGARRRSAACAYTMTPDERFIIGPDPERAGVFLCAGMSGHGFKFAPAIGEAIAETIETGQASVDLTAFSPARFAASNGG